MQEFPHRLHLDERALEIRRVFLGHFSAGADQSVIEMTTEPPDDRFITLLLANQSRVYRFLFTLVPRRDLSWN